MIRRCYRYFENYPVAAFKCTNFYPDKISSSKLISAFITSHRHICTQHIHLLLWFEYCNRVPHNSTALKKGTGLALSFFTLRYRNRPTAWEWIFRGFLSAILFVFYAREKLTAAASPSTSTWLDTLTWFPRCLPTFPLSIITNWVFGKSVSKHTHGWGEMGNNSYPIVKMCRWTDNRTQKILNCSETKKTDKY